jgi:hypothetical protein
MSSTVDSKCDQEASVKVNVLSDCYPESSSIISFISPIYQSFTYYGDRCLLKNSLKLENLFLLLL